MRSHLGGGGNDLISGDKGIDFLWGVEIDPSFPNPGLGEQDTLIGGSEADDFVLGDELQSYYIGSGDLDFALITDFQPSEDAIDVSGADAVIFSGFTFGDLGVGVGIWSQTNDLIAFVQGINATDLIADFNLFRIGFMEAN